MRVVIVLLVGLSVLPGQAVIASGVIGNAAISDRGPAGPWPDRRPLARMFLASEVQTSETNPRGWLGQSSLNALDPATFSAAMMGFADTVVARMDSFAGVKPQGIVFWDVEGLEHIEIKYTGDPQLLPVMAPEFDAIADAFFAKFTDAGYHIGFTIRPQIVSLAVDPPTQSQASTHAEALAVLKAKSDYCLNRWGARIFYIDSNFIAEGLENLMEVTVLQGLRKTFPHVLFIPEHSQVTRDGYFQFGADYADIRFTPRITSDALLAAYPGAFSVISTGGGIILDHTEELLQGVTNGDILWFDPISAMTNEQNQAVQDIYGDALGSGVVLVR